MVTGIRSVLRGFSYAYLLAGLVAIAVIPASVYGWFGIAPDPLAGVFALLLGLPWTAVLMVLDDAGPTLATAVCAAAIIVNFILLTRLARGPAAQGDNDQ